MLPNSPGLHIVQLELAFGAKEPAGQREHDEVPFKAVYLPAAHAVQAVEYF
jgi:hypothetical protein